MSSPAQTPGTPSSAPIICAGEALVDLLASDTDNWSDIASFTPRIGGAPANASVAISRLGGHAAFLGCFADDQPGDWIRQRLSAEAVDLSRSIVVGDSQTRLAVVTGPVDERDFVFYGSPAADSLLTPDQIDHGGIDQGSAVIIGSLLLLTEPGKSAMHRVLDIATRHGTPLTFDPNPRRKSWPDPRHARESMLPFIRAASILKLGVGEPVILGMTIEQIRSEQPTDSVLVLTDGSRGCWYWYGESDSEAIPPVRVTSVDSTGAGDAFTAALTLRYVAGERGIERADVEFANVVGALTTTRQGAMDALPDALTVNQYLREH